MCSVRVSSTLLIIGEFSFGIGWHGILDFLWFSTGVISDSKREPVLFPKVF
jgi:hypothetical protein